ncbi:STAS domain-containing protein [Jannaschia sp. R86511]|uniref:STAS domain-containing protein n=1 Tax=Jannaschia sp. R86511 TaxID=3093853 RepID=UPI0036D3F3CF
MSESPAGVPLLVAGYTDQVQQDGPGGGGSDVERSLMAEADAGPRLLASEALRLRQVVRRLSAGHALVLLRLDQVVAFDAAGLGLLLGLHRLARLNGAGLVLVRPTPRLMAALRRRGLHRVLVVDGSAPDVR